MTELSHSRSPDRTRQHRKPALAHPGTPHALRRAMLSVSSRSVSPARSLGRVVLLASLALGLSVACGDDGFTTNSGSGVESSGGTGAGAASSGGFLVDAASLRIFEAVIERARLTGRF